MKNIRRVVPYTPGEQAQIPGLVKLNTNENPYPPSPAVKRAIESMDYEKLRLYPDPAAELLTKAVAERYGVGADSVFVGVGSDDVIAMCFMTFFNSGKPILFPDITYSFYEVWAELFNIPYMRPALDEDFNIVPEDYMRENGGIIFPNPNAPTGAELPLEKIEQILKANPDVFVIVDEAYVDFGAKSALSLLPEYKNLIVTQTFSKSRSLAGMRIGYAIADPSVIKYLNDVKYSYNSYTMDTATILIGKAAVEDEEYFRSTTEKIIQTREWTKQQLRRLGFHFAEPKGNFIFAAHEKCPGAELFEALKEAHIFVRHFSAPRIDNYLRITIGTDEEMRRVVDFLEKYLENR